jgi:tRNA threonylcarbamoyladenosine biosynthesis protein TsaE
METVKIELSLKNINEAAQQFLEKAKPNKQFAFYGKMGAGKTTFITALCNALKALDLVSSPTFSIVNEYETESEEVIYHFDFYRIEAPEELFDIGFEEYLSENNWCFIEWPEKAEELIPESFVKVQISLLGTDSRLVEFAL